MNNYSTLFNEIEKRLDGSRMIVAVDGGSASGKTTLAQTLANRYNATVFHMDDFFLQSHQRTVNRLNEIGGNIDKERFLEEVLIHLKFDDVIKYHKFDCSTMNLSEEIEVKLSNLIIVEGVYTLHPDLESYYDLKIFLNINPKLQEERILKRNNSVFANRFFNEWIPLENTYFSETNIKNRCNMVIEIK